MLEYVHRRRVLAITLILAAAATFGLAAQTASVQAAPPAQEMKGDVDRGAYMFSAAAGCGCHITDKGFLAGGQEFNLGPAGVVYSRNITSDPEFGIGDWTETDIVTAIRTGRTPDGEMLFPVMPYITYSGMADQDAYDLAAFIKAAPAISNSVPARALNVPVPPFEPAAAPATAPTEGVARGEYLVKNVSDCSSCHTPTDAQGAPDMSKFLAGQAGEGPNITPDNDTGIGTWTEEQIAHLLKTGNRPDGSQVTGLMLEVVQGGFANLTDADRGAIASYLKTIPAVNNVPSAPQAPQLPATGTTPYNIPLMVGLGILGGVLLLGGIVVWRGGVRRSRKVGE